MGKFFIDNIRDSLDALLSEDDKIVLLGEDICDPYGGAFKVTKGLSKAYPHRLLNTPMSEQGFTGMGIGLSMLGFKPILEIMFGDFITLCADQLINHISKFVWLFDQPFNYVIRTPMGGYRGYGATHSQSLERIFFGIPNISVVALSIVDDPYLLFKSSINHGQPVLFLENKLDYSRPVINPDATNTEFQVNKIGQERFPYSLIKLSNTDTSNALIIAYGGMTSFAMEIQKEIFYEEEICVDVLNVTHVSDLSYTSVAHQLSNYSNIYIIEEGVSDFGWTSSVQIALQKQIGLKKYSVIGAKNLVIGSSKTLESYCLLQKKEVIKEIVETL